ncbi:MAG: SgcJ/EcaC family oxidoreductase [Hyphomicrobiaceae bacterium]
MSSPRTPEDLPRLFAEAWNSNDATALAGLFAEDADFVNVVGLWWRTRDDIERAHAYGLSTFFKNAELSARRVAVRRIGDKVATVHVRWQLSGQTDRDGKPLDDRVAIMIFVAEQRNGVWVVVAAHNTDVIPGSETYAAKGDVREAIDYRRKD